MRKTWLLLMLVAACSGSAVSITTPGGHKTTTTLAEPTTTFERTTTIQSSTTTTTTTRPSAFNEVFEDAQGWRYGISVRAGGGDLHGSPGGCIGTAPPGKVNASFELEIENLVDDRPAPTPPIIFISNVQTDGTTVLSGGYFDGPSGLDSASVEAFPNELARLQLCGRDAGAMSAGFDEIAPGAVLSVTVTVGPVDVEHLYKVELGIRLFAAQGQYTDAIITTDPFFGSWVVP